MPKSQVMQQRIPSPLDWSTPTQPQQSPMSNLSQSPQQSWSPSPMGNQPPLLDNFVNQYFTSKGWNRFPTRGSMEDQLYMQRWGEASTAYEQQYGTQARIGEGAKFTGAETARGAGYQAIPKAIYGQPINPLDIGWDVLNTALYATGMGWTKPLMGIGSAAAWGLGEIAPEIISPLARTIGGVSSAGMAGLQGRSLQQNWNQLSPQERALQIGMTGLLGVGGVIGLKPIAQKAAVPVARELALQPERGSLHIPGEVPKEPIKPPEPVAPEVKPLEKPPELTPQPLTGEGGIKPPVNTTINPNDYIDDFAKYVNGKQSSMDWETTQQLRHTERADKASAYMQEIEKGINQKLSPEDILRNAEYALKGKLSTVDTGIFVPPDKRQPFYTKLIETIRNDPSIPQNYKGYTMQSTRTALDNFLDGRPIPEILGTKEGSAKILLQRLFKDNPEMLKLIERPVGEPIPIDPYIVEYLRSLPQLSKAMQIDLGLSPEPILRGQPVPEALSKPTTIKLSQHLTPEEILSQTESLKLELAKQPTPISGETAEYLRTLSYSKGLKVVSYLPVSTRMKVANKLNWLKANIVDILSIPRGVRSSVDVSFSGRQALIAGTRHPVEWGKQFVRGLKALRSEELSNKVNNELFKDPDVIFGLSQTDKLDTISLSKKVGYMQRPEPFASHIADNIGIPKTGLKVRTFNRAFSVSSNSMQLGVFKQGVKALRIAGAEKWEYDALADFSNYLVGRGALPTGLQKAAPILNALMFSPKYTFARLQLPKMLVSSSPYVRKQAWQTLGTFLGFGATVLTTFKLLGGKIEYDPRSSEFGKVTIGNTRFDFWSGYLQWIRLAAQLVTGQRKDASGKIVSINRYDTLLRMGQSKDSPAMQIGTDLLTGTDYAGQKLSDKTAADVFKDYVLPFSVSDILDAAEQENLLTTVGAGAASTLGVGVVTYRNPTAPYVPPPFKINLGIGNDRSKVNLGGGTQTDRSKVNLK